MLLGVSYKNGNLWYAQITIKGVHYHIGTSKIEEEAAQLFAKAHRKYKVEGKELTSPTAFDISDVAKQPLILRKNKGTSKYQGKSSIP